MKISKKGIIAISAVIIVIVVIAAGFIIKSKLSYYSENLEGVSFEATITEIYESSILVDGADTNDYNYRDEFICSVSDDTEIYWNDTEISFEDLEVGDSVAVFFTGDIAETAPAQISNVEQIVLLDDEL